jgi:hypothetical protein
LVAATERKVHAGSFVAGARPLRLFFAPADPALATSSETREPSRNE